MGFHLALLPFFIPFCLINLSINVIVATSHCLGHQQFLLLHLRSNLIFNPAKSQKLIHWNQSGDCCQWNGVACNKGRVIGLDLCGEFISGGLDNSSLFSMQYLQNLNLVDNDFDSLIPSKFGRLKNLRYLNLSNAGFQGQITTEISHLTKLSTLDLSNCQFNGTLPSSISELTQLVHLDLSFNKFTGLLPSFNMSKNLKYLSLLHNDLTGPITSAHLEGLVYLQIINLGDNSFNGRVPSSLFTLPSLQELTLSHNGFDGLLDEFPNVSSSALQLVDLSDNKLQGPVPVSLFYLTRLGFLQLSSNEFNGTIRLDMIRKLQNLHTLGLSHNHLSIDTTFNDDHGFSSFPILQSILLASCKLREFPGFLRNQSQLSGLDLSSNQIQGIIPNWIWRFDSMIYLNLSNNFLTDLERPFGNLSSNLFIVDLHSNQLRGPIPIFTKYVVHLDYSSNRFSFVSPNIGKYLPFIYFLSLSNNSFHGKIPESFCNSSTLRMLDLSYNTFSGSIPKCLATRSSTLKVLNLAGNKLTGNISNTISSSCNLMFLDLNGNLLSGTIPKSLANCLRLQVLNLGNNLLSDRFPCFLSNISTLRVLVLRSNQLYSPIGCPDSIGNWQMLHIVDLASNNFTGTLPRTLLQSWTTMMGDKDEARRKFGNLFFDMYDNHHSVRYKDLLLVLNKVIVIKLAKLLAFTPRSVIDHIFSYYVNVDQLGGRYLDSVTVVNKGLQMKLVKIPSVFTSLDFSSNHFEGPIPEELMNLKALNVLNLSHNAFSSHIPSSLGNLTDIESLDLSNNSLSGEIPTELASLSFLSVLNLSFNHLVGKIPTGTQIQSFEANSFEGNEGLCGPPLTKNCSNDGVQGFSPPQPAYKKPSSIDWNFLSAELGFTFGFGFFIFPLIFWKRLRLWYWKHVDELLFKIVPQLDFVYEHHRGKRYRTLRWRGC